MCEDCFLDEIKAFKTQQIWDEFDWKLLKKLDSGKMKAEGFNGENYIIACITCGEKWKLADPDNAFRGYFLKSAF